MVSEKFEIEPEEEYRKERGCMGGCAKGCFVFLLVAVALLAVLIFFIYQNWRGWAADLGNMMVEEALENSNLPDQERAEVQEELQRPLAALRDGKLTARQMEQLVEVLVESPLMPSLAVTVVEAQYFAKSGLNPDERLSGRVALHRFARGVIEKKIPDDAVESVMSHIADKRENGEWRFKESATDEELRAMIATAAQEADRAGIPADVPAIDPSDEVRRVIDQVMGPVEVQEDIQAPVP